jgi:hypothetical protein
VDDVHGGCRSRQRLGIHAGRRQRLTLMVMPTSDELGKCPVYKAMGNGAAGRTEQRAVVGEASLEAG